MFQLSAPESPAEEELGVPQPPSLQAGRNKTDSHDGRSHWQLHCAHKALDMAGALGHKCVLTPSLPNSS